jgi:hypothetical protein
MHTTHLYRCAKNPRQMASHTAEAPLAKVQVNVVPR